MALQFVVHPPYTWQGFNIKISTAETHAGNFRAFWNVNEGVGGDTGANGFPTEQEAHVAAMARAKAQIGNMLGYLPVQQWRAMNML